MTRLVEGDRLDSIKPLVKWTGGKTKELSIIHDNLPTNYNRMIDPFMGGGSVLLSFDCPTVGNDACEDLIYLYKCSMDESFISELKKVTDSWTMACDPFHNELVQAVNQFKNGDVSDSEILTGKMSSMRLLESKKNYQYTDEQIKIGRAHV